MPQAPRTRFSLTLPSRYALLSSAYPFSACPNRQPFVLGLRKGTPTYFLFPHFLIIARQTIGLTQVVDMIGRNHRATASHVLHYDFGFSRDIFAHVLGDKACP